MGPRYVDFQVKIYESLLLWTGDRKRIGERIA